MRINKASIFVNLAMFAVLLLVMLGEAGGAAALGKDRFSSYTPGQIQSYLELNGVGLAVAGKDNLYGSGRLYMLTPVLPPTLNTGAATGVEETTATLNGDITHTGGEPCLYRGFVWGDESRSKPGHAAPASSSYDSYWTQRGRYVRGTFNHGISSLSKGTKYYYRACARNSGGWSYGNEQSFLTKPDAPTGFDASTAGSSQIDLSWAKGDGAQKTKIQRKEGSYPTNRDDGTQVYFDTGASTSDTGLLPGTTYYYRAWSHVSGSEQWSDEYAEAWNTTSGAENLLSEPASAVMEIPLTGDVLEPEEIGASGWQNIMTDGFEGAFPGQWGIWVHPSASDAYWGKDDHRAHAGSYSAFCAKSGSAGVNPPANYRNNMNAWMFYGPFSLADAIDAKVDYWLWLESEIYIDWVVCMASVDGSNFYGWGWSGNSGGWVSESLDLTDVYTLGNLCGEPEVWIAFQFWSDSALCYQGAFIDDVVLRKMAKRPDLVVSKWVEPFGEDFTVSYNVTNIGNATANASTTCKYLNGVLMETRFCPPLAPGESYSGHFDPEPCPCGQTINVTVCADNYFNVTESNEFNNCEVNIVDCPAMPDLVTTEKWELWVDFDAKTYNISYTVTNQGCAAGASNTTITIDGIDVLEDPVPPLAAGAEYSNTLGPYFMSGDSDNITVCADNDGVVDESDETNNCQNNTLYGGVLITGVTTEVDCSTEAGVTVTAYDGGDEKGSTTSEGDVTYTLASSISETGTYTLIASKTGFRDKSQEINISDLGQQYELDFRGETGLVPNEAAPSYAMDCVNHWLFPPGPECGLSAARAMDVVNAWLFPIT